MNSAPLRVLIPRFMDHLVKESGIGAATRHQEKIVERLGHTIVRSPAHEFDVVHLNTPFPDTAGFAAIARMKKKPILMWAHSTEEDFRDSFTGANPVAPLFRRWIAFLYRQGTAVITPSDYARTLIAAPKYGITTPIHVLSNGVDTEFFRPDPSARERLRSSLGLPSESPVVVSVGMQLVRKGIVDWVEVARAMPDVTFVWYGRTDPRIITKEVRRALESAPSNAIFPGYVQASQIRDAYCGADAFCFLTKEETEGIVMLEALACGVPIVVRGIPIYREQFPHGAVTFQVNGEGITLVAETERTLRGILDGSLPDLRAHARETALTYSLDRVGEQLTGIYTSVL